MQRAHLVRRQVGLFVLPPAMRGADVSLRRALVRKGFMPDVPALLEKGREIREWEAKVRPHAGIAIDVSSGRVTIESAPVVTVQR